MIPVFEFYIRQPNCFPLKAHEGEQIAGIGAANVFGSTCWLAHIIVDPVFRRRGIGLQMVEALLQVNAAAKIKTFLLIATELGLPVYEKAGFRTVTDYRFLKNESCREEIPATNAAVPWQQKYTRSLLSLDRKCSGEKRDWLLREHLKNGWLIVTGDQVSGFWLPDLGEGVIIADNEAAGLALMKMKYRSKNKAVLPADNIAGIDFLFQYGFEPMNILGTRMILGEDIPWQPRKIFSRIGGHFG